MSVFISADMEGISGVVDNVYTTPGEADYPRARQLMTDDCNAAIEGALEGGATRIIVNDSHGPMRNILIEHLHPAATLISGSPKPLSMMTGIDQGWNMAFFVGYHAKAGTPDAILDHTWSGIIYEVFLNGREVGEIGLNAALAGSLGVPIALVTGDDKAAAEAKDFLGDGLQTAIVKRAVGRYAAECMSLDEARRLIREAARTAVSSPPPAPLKMEAPYHLVVGWGKSMYAEVAATIPGSRRLDGRHVEIVLDDMAQLYKAWRAFNSLASTVS